jgi:preprotein translocase YajC subunit
MPQGALQIGGIVLIFVIMYLLMIRPQRKREKQVNEMRSALKAGDSITTIGGIKGKVTSVKDDSLILQVGADKIKIEIMRWAVSKVDVAGAAPKAGAKKPAEKAEEKKDEPAPVRKPRKLTAKTDAEPDGEKDTESESDE